MVWKVFFIITTIIIIILNMLGYSSSDCSMSNLEQVAGTLFSIAMTFILGIFYSLGWNQKLFSNKAKNIFTIFFIIGVISFIVSTSIYIFQELSMVEEAYSLVIIGAILGSLILTVFSNIFLIPFYYGLVKYNKVFSDSSIAQKPYWKLFSIFSVVSLFAFILFSLTKVSHFASYNLLDFVMLFSCIYEIIFLIAFAWDKEIFNKLFWKITFIPYVVSLFFIPKYNSELFNQDFNLQYILNNPAALVEVIIINILFVYVLYKYAFTKEVRNEI